jgi:hypothetical protein
VGQNTHQQRLLHTEITLRFPRAEFFIAERLIDFQTELCFMELNGKA